MNRPLVPEDLFRFVVPEDVAISSRGDELYVVEQSIDQEKNTYRRHILAVDRDTLQSRPLTHGPQDSTPRPSPDGRHLAFLRRVDDWQQLFLMSFAGGEPRSLADWDRDAANPVWFPDGQSLLVEVDLEDRELPATREAHAKNEEKRGLKDKYTQDVRYITRIFYRLDTAGYLDHTRHRHLVRLSVDMRRDPEVLTHGAFHHSQAAIHPNGTSVAYQSNRQEDPDMNPYEDLFLLDLQSGQEKQITDGRGSYGAPQFSPDGRWLYFFGHRYTEGFYTQTKLFRVSVNDGTPGRPELIWDPGDHDFGNEAIDDMHAHGAPSLRLGISPDGNRLIALVSSRGSVQPAEWNVAEQRMRWLTEGSRVIYGWASDRSLSRFVLLQADAESPGDVFAAQYDGHRFDMRRVTHYNQELLNELAVARPQHFTFQSQPLGEEMDGWYLLPNGVGPHPLALEVHGGPMTMYAPTFFFEFQMLVSAGIGVVFTNPHGSRGYGEPFCSSIKGAWGQEDFRDVMAGLDRALSTKLFDEKRLAILGGSYGGFMTNWAIGHSERFRAAVTMRSVVDEFSFFGTSDVGYLDEWEWDTTPWQNPQRYLEASPFMSVSKMHTPLLIIHSEEDYRCPISQAEELFAALKRLGREVAFARFPGESHELSRSGKPWHRVKRLELIREWLTGHLLG